MSKIIRWTKVVVSFLFFGCLFPFYKRIYGTTNVLSIRNTLLKIINEDISVSRFGDGEYRLIINKGLVLQKKNIELSKRLIDVFLNKNEKLMICIVDHTNFKNKKFEIMVHHVRCYVQMYKMYKHLLLKGYKYGDANITRFYMDMKNKSEVKGLFDLWKQVWQNREIVIFEGEKTRFGIGNDLLDNVKSIERVLCPASQAFDFYDQILEQARQLSKNKLLFFSLGATATLAASDLTNEGYRVIDIGHLDIEYEWFISNASNSIKIDIKQISEVSDGTLVTDPIDDLYYSQIIAKIGI